jgi:hypothetical protein
MKRFAGIVAFAALALTGCGTICDDMLDASDTYRAKYSPCSSTLENIFDNEAFNVTQCERTVDKCTDAEMDAINDYADCLRALPECSPSSKDTFKNAVEGCNLKIKDKVGSTCRAAL